MRFFAIFCGHNMSHTFCCSVHIWGGVERSGGGWAPNVHSPAIIYMRLPTRSWCSVLSSELAFGTSSTLFMLSSDVALGNSNKILVLSSSLGLGTSTCSWCYALTSLLKLKFGVTIKIHSQEDREQRYFIHWQADLWTKKCGIMSLCSNGAKTTKTVFGEP